MSFKSAQWDVETNDHFGASTFKIEVDECFRATTNQVQQPGDELGMTAAHTAVPTLIFCFTDC
jgi:hypothetical protein